jgi:hypothetical protein
LVKGWRWIESSHFDDETGCGLEINKTGGNNVWGLLSELYLVQDVRQFGQWILNFNL